ncbi:uncharacterized protein CCR75_000125 [Bremia lactucae]|uniref:Uncharacterized protein n=1 Tax=Bremia lactucae TaxID=4779 RepID=A0A976IHQ0_BRELC|nr:hypothetical protein CCR75_000125 [Bremia lactucae]
MDKTVIFPFQPWKPSDSCLIDTLCTLGTRVLNTDENTTLLGILVGTQIRPSLQLNKLLVRFQRLCVSLRWRARTLQGRVLLIKTMIQSILWHFMSVQVVSQTELKLFDPLIRNFINNTPSRTTHDTPTRSQFSSKWHSAPINAGGLDLHTVADSVELLQVNLIRQLIKHCRTRVSSPPKWFLPAYAAFDYALQGQAIGLDFLLYGLHLVGKMYLTIGNRRLLYGVQKLCPNSRTRTQFILN